MARSVRCLAPTVIVETTPVAPSFCHANQGGCDAIWMGCFDDDVREVRMSGDGDGGGSEGERERDRQRQRRRARSRDREGGGNVPRGDVGGRRGGGGVGVSR